MGADNRIHGAGHTGRGRRMSFSSSHSRFLWVLHNTRLRVLLADVAADLRRSIVGGVNQQVLEAFHEGDASTETQRLIDALGRLGPVDGFLPDLMRAHDLGLADVRYAQVALPPGKTALGRQVAVSAFRLLFALVLVGGGLAVSLFSIAALVAPTRFGFFQTGVDSYQLQLFARASSGDSLLSPWLLIAVTAAGAFAARAGIISAFGTLLELIAKASNLFRPWRVG